MEALNRWGARGEAKVAPERKGGKRKPVFGATPVAK